MKKLLITLTLALSCILPVKAQTNDTWQSRALTFKQYVEDTKTLTVAVYPSYAPSLKIGGVDKPWGFGVAALYPLSDHTFTGFRADYLGGDFFAAQANVGAKADFQIFGHNFTTYGVTGALLPIQGAGGDNFSPGYIVGGGVRTTIYQKQMKNGNFALGIGYEGERWQVPNTVLNGIFVHHVAVDATWRF